ncbi:hypothetical protein AY599_22840 [Leptolyngbya valderiana BDU 20041]|nr:hypothetical protein AY599_22840 [Leptolyngbya valderiana BDU 20041]
MKDLCQLFNSFCAYLIFITKWCSTKYTPIGLFMLLRISFFIYVGYAMKIADEKSGLHGLTQDLIPVSISIY